MLDDVDRRIVAATQSGLPLVPRPYRAVGEMTGISEAEAIARMERLLACGAIRRIGVIPNHYALGLTANGMSVWDVPDERVGELGRRIAADPCVTLCYRRARALPDWPYNLYCMVHGRERSRVIYDVKRITAQHGAGQFPRVVLFSNRCFAQRAAKYG